MELHWGWWLFLKRDRRVTGKNIKYPLMYGGWVDSFLSVKATFTTCSLIPSGPKGAHVPNFASMTYHDKTNEAYCDERLSLGEFPWHGKRQSSRSGSEKRNRQWWTPPTHIIVTLLYRSVDLLWPGSEVWAWLSIGASVGAEERQLAKGWVEVRL